MRNSHESIRVAPWLFGSSVFQKRIDDLPSLLDTLEENPIDTFCGSSSNYQLLDQSPQQQHHTHLKQLFATQSIDPKVKARWHSLTQLKIHDGLRIDCFFYLLICIVHLDYTELSPRPNLCTGVANM